MSWRKHLAIDLGCIGGASAFALSGSLACVVSLTVIAVSLAVRRAVDQRLIDHLRAGRCRS